MKKTVAATKLADDDEVVSVSVVREQTHIVLRSADGYFLRFQIDEIPEKKKGAIGVRGMKLSAKDFVEEVYYHKNMVESSVVYKEKEITSVWSLYDVLFGKFIRVVTPDAGLVKGVSAGITPSGELIVEDSITSATHIITAGSIIR